MLHLHARLFCSNAQESADLRKPNLLLKDDRLRPLWRILLFALAFPTLTVALWSAYFALIGGARHEPPRLSEEISGEIAELAAAMITAFWMRRFVDRRSIGSLGLWLGQPAFRLLWLGIAFGVFMQAVTFGLEAAAGSTRVSGLGALRSDAGALGYSFVFFLAVACFEELVFRGYLFQNFWEAFGLAPAIVITSALFAAFHLYNPNAQANIAQTLAGLLLYAVWACFSMVWTKSLWLAIGAHLAWNFFEGPVFGFPVSGIVMPFPTLLKQTTGGPTWLTGGAFGPEAGVSSLVALLLGLAVLAVLARRGVFADSPDVREAYARSP